MSTLEPQSILFGGREVDPRRDQFTTPTPRWAYAFSRLAARYVTAEAEFPPHLIPDRSDMAQMKEEIAHWAARVWFHSNEVPVGDELRRFDILSLEDQYREYMKSFGPALFERGMTVDEVWASQSLYSAAPMLAILTETYSKLASVRVPDRLILPPDELVWLLTAICAGFPEEDNPINVLVTNGSSGHTIQLRDLNRVPFFHPRGMTIGAGWLSFHDPWPARSLLAPEQDYQITSVVENIAHPPFWLIAPEDFEKVVVGAVFPIDLLPKILLVLRSLDLMKQIREAEKWKGPFWTEGAMDGRTPFPITLKTTTTEMSKAVSFLYLAQSFLFADDPGPAREYLIAAYRAGSREVREKCILVAEAHDQPDVVRELAAIR
jgi:hypothetical protein